MSIGLTIISLLVFAYRLKKGLATKPEKILWLLWFVHLLVVAPLAMYLHPQHRLDTRYVKPADVLVWGATIWALLKLKYGKYVGYGVLGLLVVYNAVMFTKHLVPGSRRNANLIACDWAEKLIREDWRSIDLPPDPKFFTIYEYTTGGRPTVSPISKRMNYHLGARNGAEILGFYEGRPDYIVEEDKRLKFEPWQKSDYVLMDELQIKKRHYSLYKLYRHHECEDLDYAREHLVNLYPRRDAITFEVDNTSGDSRVFCPFYSDPLLKTIKPGEKYTYVFELLELEGMAPKFAIGHTEFGNSQLSVARFQPTHPQVLFFTLTGRDIAEDNGFKRFLERSYCYCEPGEKFKVTFRVSLFIGTEVNSENFHYVLPNEALR